CLALLPRYFFVAPPPTHQYHTLPLHDALPIAVARHPSRGDAALRGAAPATRHLSVVDTGQRRLRARRGRTARTPPGMARADRLRSEEHTSELQSRENLVCRLLLEKKNGRNNKQ